jgi:hypothetical protein
MTKLNGDARKRALTERIIGRDDSLDDGLRLCINLCKSVGQTTHELNRHSGKYINKRPAGAIPPTRCGGR